MNYKYLLAGIAVMALTTYLIRMLPMVIFRKKISIFNRLFSKNSSNTLIKIDYYSYCKCKLIFTE